MSAGISMRLFEQLFPCPRSPLYISTYGVMPSMTKARKFEPLSRIGTNSL